MEIKDEKSTVKASEKKVVAKSNKIIPKRKKIDKDKLVLCKNITNGTLIYKSKKTGAIYELQGYGASELFEVSELMTMKSSQGVFLTEPWLLIEDDEVIDFLGLRNIYDRISVPADDIDSVFSMAPEKIEQVLTMSPNGIKALIGQRAKQLVDEGKLDSIKRINIIESKLNINLVE